MKIAHGIPSMHRKPDGRWSFRPVEALLIIAALVGAMALPALADFAIVQRFGGVQILLTEPVTVQDVRDAIDALRVVEAGMVE
jgi:hypothetical protein